MYNNIKVLPLAKLWRTLQKGSKLPFVLSLFRKVKKRFGSRRGTYTKIFIRSEKMKRLSISRSRVISICLAVAMIFTMLMPITASAAELPEFYVKNVSGAKAGQNVKIEVGVSGLSADKAMDTFGVTLTYPEGFTYVSAVATSKVTDVCKLTIDGVEENAYWIEHDAEKRTVTLVAVVNTVTLAAGGIAEDGVLLEATFTSPASFPAGGYTFTATALESGFVDLTGKTVEVTTKDGTVKSVLKGDVNGDGSVSPKDRAAIIRYFASWDAYQSIDMDAADVNGDGAVTPKDSAYLVRYFAGWSGYTVE